MARRKTVTRRSFIKNTAALSLGTTLGASCSSLSSTKNSKKPNLVFVFPDQMRNHAMGFMKQDPVLTPVLDQFSKESILFTRATSTHPLCSPYRGTLFTGLYPNKSGLPTNCHGTRKDVYLRRSTQTFTDILAAQGYDIGYIGKWHLKTPEANKGYKGPWIPKADRHSINFWYSWTDQHQNNFRPSYWKNDASKEERIQPGRIWAPIHETDIAINYINNHNKAYRNEQKPFVLFVSWNPPHDPYQKKDVPAKYYEQYGDASSEELLNRPNIQRSQKTERAFQHARGYFASVTGVDDQFGRILKTLKDQGLEEDTLVIFTSDHGEMLGSQGLMAKNHFYEESFNIPLLMRWKGKLKPKTEDLLIGTPDLMPTMLSLLGLQAQIPSNVQGLDLSAAILNQKNAKRPEIAWYYNASNNGRGLRTQQFACFFERAKNEQSNYLFDVKNDPYQIENLAQQKPKLLQEYGGQVFEWLQKIEDNFSDYKKTKAYIHTIPV